MRRQPSIARCIEARSVRSPSTTSAPSRRRASARSSSRRTKARTLCPFASRNSVSLLRFHTGGVMIVFRCALRICFSALCALLLGAASAHAQEYPNQTVKIVVPFVAGGGVDVVARIVAPKLSKELGQSVIIENRGGAGGALGATAVAQSPPDGYTLLIGTGSTHGTNSNVYARLSYDPVRDFVPVVLLSSSPLLLIVPQASPARNVGELIALGRSRPGELRFGSYGTGSIDHLA